MDPNTCPECGASGAYTFRELQRRTTWQPLNLVVKADGSLLEDDYEAFDWADDCDVEGFECDVCMASWETLAELRAAQLREASLSQSERDGDA